jgi:hypothetical protein
MPALEMPPNAGEFLLQTSPGRSPAPLELFVRLGAPDEFHFYTQGLTMVDFGSLFARELRPLDALIYRIPPDLLNPNYWEPLTKEAENAVRERMTGIVTKTEGDRAMLFRADRVSRGRLLRDGLDVPVELLNGYVFRTSGAGLLKLGQAWSGRGRFEWAGLLGLPGEGFSHDVISTIHHDLSHARLSLREEQMLFAAQEDGLARTVFSKRGSLDRAVEALIRGFVRESAKVHVGRMSHAILEELIGLVDGLGISADPSRDIVNTGRTVEVSLWLGRTPWGVYPRPGRDAVLAKEKSLLYYDNISGLWDLAT